MMTWALILTLIVDTVDGRRASTQIVDKFPTLEACREGRKEYVWLDTMLGIPAGPIPEDVLYCTRDFREEGPVPQLRL